MPVKEADPEAKSLDAAFAAAQRGPAKPKEAATPPEVDHEAPHGRGEDGRPLAPHGYNKDGSVKKTAAGRKPKDEQARTVEPGNEPAGSQPVTGTVIPPKDFSAALMNAGDALWFGGSMIAKVGPKVPLLGRLVPGQKLSATMAVFGAHKPTLAAALNEAAQHDLKARKLAVKLSEGEVGWQLTCMFMVAPFVATIGAVWQGDEALAERELPLLAELVSKNEKAMDEMMTKISAQMEAAQAKAQAEAEARMAAEQNGQVTGDAVQA
jgi:hypothetical protein